MTGALVLLVGILPASRLKNLLLRWLGWRVASGARVGVCLFWRARADLADGALIRSGNVFRSVAVQLGSRASIGAWNWVSASPEFSAGAGPAQVLRLGDHAALTSRHYVDASGGVTVGRLTTVAGQRSTILSHSIDLRRNVQRVAPVTIGDYCFIGTNAVLLAGSALPDRSVLAAGGVLIASSDDREPGLWGGVPARRLGDAEGAYFHRRTGYVQVDGDAAIDPDLSIGPRGAPR